MIQKIKENQTQLTKEISKQNNPESSSTYTRCIDRKLNKQDSSPSQKGTSNDSKDTAS